MSTMSIITNNIAHFFISHQKFFFWLAVNIGVIYIFSKIIDIINQRVLLKLRSKVSDYPMLTVVPISLKALKFVIACMLFACLLQSFGYNVTSIVAGFGIVGLAVGFAAQTTIGNVFGSFSLLIDKVYKIGDYIKFEDKSGFVENINLRSTTFRTAEGFLLNVPNNLLANTSIINVSQTCKYKLELDVAIECNTPVEVVKKAVTIIQELADKEPSLDDNALAFIESIKDTAINLKLIAFTKNTRWKEYMICRSNLIADIIAKFQENKIDFDVPDSRISIEDMSKIMR